MPQLHNVTDNFMYMCKCMHAKGYAVWMCACVCVCMWFSWNLFAKENVFNRHFIIVHRVVWCFIGVSIQWNQPRRVCLQRNLQIKVFDVSTMKVSIDDVIPAWRHTAKIFISFIFSPALLLPFFAINTHVNRIVLRDWSCDIKQ